MDKKILLDKLIQAFGVTGIPDSLEEKRELYDSLVEEATNEPSSDILDTEDKYLRLELTNKKLIDAEKYPCINKTLNNSYVNGEKIAVVKGDFLDIYTDVVVNPVRSDFAFDKSLKISNHLFHSAGRRLQKKCLDTKGESLAAGDVLITRAYNLLSDFIIHVVLPEGKGKKRVELGISYFNVFECANNNLAKLIVVPPLEFKKYGLTIEEGISISLYETMRYLSSDKCLLEKIIFCFKTNREYNLFVEELNSYLNKKSS